MSAAAAGVTAVLTTADGTTHEATLPQQCQSFDQLIQAVKQAFGSAAPQDLAVSDGQHNIRTDADAQQLRPGQRILVRSAQAQEGAVFQERISFNPHPKTLTMAGDYEYFAAQGYHPLAFALAELIDNSLRATKGNKERPRSITVSLITDDQGSQGMICVSDNGSGMNKQELNNWAVMNLSMEDRGLLNAEEAKAGSRYLSSDISFFGVGSKNAAFYLGRIVKVVTKTQDSTYVHELCIQAAELERRYRAGQAVYEEVMLHRQPGDASSMGKFEQAFQQPQQLVEQEVVITSSSDEPEAATTNSSSSFTRVLVYDLKDEVLEQLSDEDRGATILRDLAHLYHYYLHGEKGNDGTSARTGLLPNGERIPSVHVERRLSTGACCWARELVDVDDDLESRYLAAQCSKLEFALTVPNHGRVEGVLWYFAYENDQESVPLDPHTMGRMLLMANRGMEGAATQNPAAAGGLRALTQLGGPSQVAAMQSQRQTQAAGALGRKQGHPMEPEPMEVEAAGMANLLAACPTFETFWQGRLIPGACVDTLPFVRSVRVKRSAAAKDLLPDEVFSRIRGALFLGPGFRVTRNKLTFRDNLSLLLESSSPTDRQLEKRFKEWLGKCHKELDRTIKFEALCSQAVQAKARQHLGQDVTVFERIHDGVQTISKGDIIRLNTKPAVLGRVEHFSIPQVVQVEGCYSGGRVTVCALPVELLGADNLHTWPLRRLEGKVTQAELEEHASKELAKMPASLQFEPMKLCGPSVTTLLAGSTLPETSISVLNGSKGKIVKALLAGRRHHLEVVQTLYYLGPAGTGRKRTAAAAGQQGVAGAEGAEAGAAAEGAEGAAEAPEEGAAGKKAGGKRGKRRKKGPASGGKENSAPEDDAAAQKAGSPAPEEEEDYVPQGEVVLTVDNKSPLHDAFQFQRISGGLTRAGCYCLQYSLKPELPNGRTLRFSIDLEVTAGPPVGFDIQGEGRAIALSKSVLLGEALPPMRLVFQDSHGNTVPVGAGGGSSEAQQQPAVTLQVLEAGPGGGGAVLQELQAAADMEPCPDGVSMQGMRLLGSATASTNGMQLFKPQQLPAASAAAEAASHGQRGLRGTTRCAGAAAATGGAGVSIVRAVDVYLAVHVEGMPQQGFPVRLAPGAPSAVRLLKGHPFSSSSAGEGGSADQGLPQQVSLTQLAPEQQLVPAEVLSGEQLPPFKVQALDAWGNATAPQDSLPFEIRVECVAAEPDAATFPVDDRGVATITGLSIFRQDVQAGSQQQQQQPHEAKSADPQPHQLLVWPDCDAGEDPLVAQALQIAEPINRLPLQLSVLPSNMPAELLMTFQGAELARRMQKGADGEDILVWQLLGVQAGERVKGLAVRCVDEVGRPATAGVKGKVQVSWVKGSKTAVLGGTDIKLPALNAPDAVGDPQPFWVRFIGDAKEWPGVSLDIQFEVSVVPGPPASWGVAIVERYHTIPAAVAAGGRQQEGDSLSMIPCGKPFTLEIEALDVNHNRCTFAVAEERPTPVVLCEPEDPEVQLTLEPDSWVHKWDNTQAGGEVCQFKMWLAGPPGPVRLIVRDRAGDDGASALAPDELPIQLLPGPAAALVADCPQQLQCGTKGVIDSLPIKAVDAYGNLVDTCSFDVSLNGSAFNLDGSVAARVSAAGSNRAALRNGVAAFKGIRVQARDEGEYKLTIGSHSKKVAIQEAAVIVKLVQHNFVCNLEVLPASLPAADGSTSAAGCSLVLLATVETENQQPLPWDALSSGLTLSLELPDAADAAAAAAGGGAGGGSSKGGKAGRGAKGAASKRTETLVLTPECMFGVPQQTEGLGAAAAEAAGAAAASGCVVCFRTPALTVAGGYTVAAEYRETRDELLAGMKKEEQRLRSTSQQFEIASGPVASAVLQAAGADQEQLTISNGKDASGRRLLRNAVVQLFDGHSNPAAAAGVAVRWRLYCTDSDAARGGAEAPQLSVATGELELQSNDKGRAFFGDVGVEEGTGKMLAGSSGQGLECTLEVQVLLPRSKSRRSSSTAGSDGSWTTVWERPVLFSDDSARIRELQELQSRKEQLQEQLAAVKASMDEVAQRVTSAQQEHRAAQQAAAERMQALQRVLRRPGLQPPSNAAEAKQLLAQLQQQAAEQQQRPELGPQYGGQRHPIAAGITKLLQLNDPDVVGVFAQLGYVDEPRLSSVLAANYASTLQVLVVKSYDAITRLRSIAQQAKVPIPAMLADSLIQAFQPEPSNCGANTRMRGMTELAQRLMADACQGSDAPLVMALPHTRQLSLYSSQGRAPPADASLAADQWPPGCLGFAVNLVRPAVANTRHNLMYSQIGRTLVFESLDQAASYRQYVCKTLRGSPADIVSLCGKKLSGRGVVLGSGFKVLPVEQAPCRFGTIPRRQQDGTPAGSQCEAAAEGLIEALQQQEDVAQELRAAQEEAAQPEQQELRQQQEALQQQLRQLSAQMRQRGGGGGGATQRAGRAAAEEAAADDGPAAAAGAGGCGDGAEPAARQQQQQQRTSKRRRA